MTTTTFEDLFRSDRSSREFRIEGLRLEFSEALTRAMEEQGLSRVGLARRPGQSSDWVTRILRGELDPTLAEMVGLADAVGLESQIAFAAPAASKGRRINR